MRSSLQIRCRVQSVQIFCILLLQMFLLILQRTVHVVRSACAAASATYGLG